MPDTEKDLDLRRKATDSDDKDAQGNSMFLYEAARQMSRQAEHDAKEAARQARMLKEEKSKGR